MKPEELVRKYIESNEVMQLATEENGQPRICNLHYVFDEENNLYWMSMRNTKHSEALRNNKKTAISILQNPDNKQCVHMEGGAFELSGSEAVNAHEIYGAKFGQKDQRLVEAQSGDPQLRAYYVFKPTHIVLFDEKNFPDSPRQET
jgi:uncharacterized protein YhbP (UPF0306 family)